MNILKLGAIALLCMPAACDDCPLDDNQTLTVEQTGETVTFHWTDDNVVELSVVHWQEFDAGTMSGPIIWAANALAGKTIASPVEYNSERADFEVSGEAGPALESGELYDVTLKMQDGETVCHALAEFQLGAQTAALVRLDAPAAPCNGAVR